MKAKAGPSNNESSAAAMPLNSLAVGRTGGMLALPQHLMNKNAMCWPGAATASSPANKTAALITPTSAAEEDHRNVSASPQNSMEDAARSSPPPPFVLKRQASEVSAWMSEVDSHYHSDNDDDESSWGGGTKGTNKSLALSEVDSQGTFRPPSIITASVTPHSSPSKECVQPQQSRIIQRKPSKKATVTLSSVSSSSKNPSTSNAVLAVYQERLRLAEDQKVGLSQRLALVERNHRQVAQDLREAEWETSRLEELVHDQQAKISKLEEEQVITEKWRQEMAQQDAQLLDDLKEAQEKLHTSEQEKMHLMNEMVGLQKTVQEDAVNVKSIQKQRDELLHRFDQLNDQYEGLTDRKKTVESQLQSALHKQNELEASLKAVHQDLQNEKGMREELEETNLALNKRVRFAGEQLEAAQHENTTLQLRFTDFQAEAERTHLQLGKEITSLKSSLKVAKDETQDLYQSWQAALEEKRTMQFEVEDFKSTSAELLLFVATELESTIAAKESMEASFKSVLKQKENLLAQEQTKMKRQKQDYESKLNNTLGKVRELQQTLETSEDSIVSLESERKALATKQESLQEKLQENEHSLQALEGERLSLRQTLEDMQTQQSTLSYLHDEAQAEVQRKLEQVESEAARRQIQALKERKSLEHDLKEHTKRIEDLQAKTLALQSENEKLIQEKEELVQQAAELQTALLDETPKLALQAMESDRDRLQEVVAELQESHAALQQEYQESVTKIADIQMELDQALEQHQPLQQQAASASERARSLEKQLKQAEEEANDLSLANEELRNQHSKLMKKQSESQQQIENLEAAKIQALKTIDELESGSQKLQFEIQDLEASRALIYEELAHAEILLAKVDANHATTQECLRDDLSNSQSEVEVLKTLVASLESKMKSLIQSHKDEVRNTSDAYGNEVEALRTRIATVKSHGDKEQSRLEAEQIRFTETLNLASIESQQLREQLRSNETALTAANAEKESLASQIKVSASTIGYLETELKSYKEEVSWMKTEMETLTNVNTNLQASLNEAETRIEALTTEKALCEKELSELKVENNRLKSELQEAQNVRKHLEEQLGTSTKLNTELEAQSTLKDNEIALLKGASKELRGQIHDLQATLARQVELEKHYDELQGKLEEKQHDLDTTVAEKYKVCTEKYALAEKLDALISDFSDLQTTNQTILSRQGELETESRQLQSVIDSLESENLRLLASDETQRKGKEAMLLSVNAEKEELLRRLNILQEEKADAARDLSRARELIAGLENKISEIQNDLCGSDEMRKAAEETVRHVTSEKAGLLKVVENLTEQLTSVQEERRSTEKLVVESEAKLAQLQDQVHQCKEDKARISIHEKELEDELVGSRQQIASLANQSCLLQAKIQELEVQKLSVASQENALMSSLYVSKEEETKLRMALSDANTALCALKDENANLAARLEGTESIVEKMKIDVEETSRKSIFAVEQLGKQLLEGKDELRKVCGELKASKKTNSALKRAAKYLVKRVRELEAETGLKESLFVFSSDMASSPARKANRVSLSSDENEDEISQSSDSSRVIQEPISLSMQYRDDSGSLRSYQVPSTYTGPLVNGLPHGPGMLRFENKEMILAEFEKGEICGIAAFSERQRYHHANMVVFGSYEKKEHFDGDMNDIPPLQRVTVARK